MTSQTAQPDVVVLCDVCHEMEAVTTIDTFLDKDECIVCPLCEVAFGDADEG